MKPALLTEPFDTGRDNSALGAVYLAVLVFGLSAYLFLAVLPAEGYNPDLYGNTYVYFLVFDLLWFSLVVPFWQTGSFAKTAVGIAALALSPVPLVLFIFMAGRINPVNFLLPLVLKAVWGLAVICLRDLLAAVKPGWRWQGFLTGLFVFAVLVLGGLLTYCVAEYREAVVTTLYDKEIPGAFFLNPLLSLAGLVYYQAGGGSQASLTPFYACTIFWGLIAALLRLAAARIPGGGAARG
jgi:hypothetical protein